MNCKKCNSVIPDGAFYCPGCGASANEEKTCPNCHTQVIPGDAFCQYCGTRLQSTEYVGIKKESKKKNKGCTCVLITLGSVIVAFIALFLILYCISLIRYYYFEDKQETAKIHIRLIDDALAQYNLDVMRYPSNLKGLIENIDKSDRWDGPYIRPAIPQDPWGNEYYYFYDEDNGDYYLFTFGADKKEGGEGENADLGVSSKRTHNI